jgi:hypothetical protein
MTEIHMRRLLDQDQEPTYSDEQLFNSCNPEYVGKFAGVIVSAFSQLGERTAREMEVFADELERMVKVEADKIREEAAVARSRVAVRAEGVADFASRAQHLIEGFGRVLDRTGNL